MNTFRRFISYVGGVKPKDIQSSTFRNAVENAMNELETTVSFMSPCWRLCKFLTECGGHNAELKGQASRDQVCQFTNNVVFGLLILLTRGSKPHRSHKDPSDPKDVISVRVRDANGDRLFTTHVHEDGTYTSK